MTEEHGNPGEDDLSHSMEEKLKLVDDTVPPEKEVSDRIKQVSNPMDLSDLKVSSGDPACLEAATLNSSKKDDSADAVDGVAAVTSGRTTDTDPGGEVNGASSADKGESQNLNKEHTTKALPGGTDTMVYNLPPAHNVIQGDVSVKNDVIPTAVSASLTEEASDANSKENGRPSQPQNVENGTDDKEIENHYEIDDYYIITEGPKSAGEDVNAHRDSLPAPPPPVPASGSNQDEEHIYEFDDEDDQSPVDKEEDGGLVNGKSTPGSRTQLKESLYEEISEDNTHAGNGGTGKRRTESESSGGVAKTENEGGESKSSSIASVTLDLYHIDKTDPLYSSGGDNRLSGSYSNSGSVEVLAMAPRRISDVNSTESSEEARDGMMTPVEITHSESMFIQARERMETAGHATNEDQARIGVRREVDDDATSNDSAEYSSLPDEDENLMMMMNTRISAAAQKKSRNWLSRTMERPIFVRKVPFVILRSCMR